MRTRHLSLIPLLALAQGVGAQEPERFAIAGATVAVYNLAGAVTIERGTGDNVVVEVTRAGRDAGRLRIERMDVNGRSALVVRYPGDDVVYDELGRGSRTSMYVRRDGTFFGQGDRGDRVTISGSGGGTHAHADVRILVPAGRSVDVRLGAGRVRAGGVEGDLDIDVAAAAVETRDTRGRLRIDTGSGRVSVNGAEGEVLIDTGSGSVVVNDVQGESLNVDTGSGGVTGRGISAPTLNVDTGSGSIALFDVTARDIVLETGSGRVELDLVSQVNRVRIDTGSGSVRLAVPASLAASLDIDTGSGGITSDVPVTVTRSSRNRLVGMIGTGGGTIEVDTGSGSVRISRR